MFASAAAAYYSRFENEFLREKGEAFQSFFQELMGRAYPGNFEPCRPSGSAGDWKNDGFLNSESRLFQVYAPERILSAPACKKIQEDFAGAIKHWKGQLKVWTFVHNDSKALPAQACKLLQNLRTSHPSVKIEVWGKHELTEVFKSLSETDLETWFGHLAITRSTFDAVEQLLSQMGTRGPGAIFAPSTAEQRMAHYLACCVHAFRAHEELGIDSEQNSSKVPDIWDIFVPPGCTAVALTPEEMEAAQCKTPPENPAKGLLPLLANENVLRHVLLGDPGMGKSTLIQSLVAGLADGQPFVSGSSFESCLPIPFILRDLVPLLNDAHPDASSWSWDTLCRSFHASYKRNNQTQILCLAWSSYHAFRSELLTHPQALFLLDGLDEIGDIKKRSAIRDAIWQGFRTHPKARWIITSRIVGYEAVPVDRDYFTYYLNTVTSQPEQADPPDEVLAAISERWGEVKPDVFGDGLEAYAKNKASQRIIPLTLASRYYLSPFDNSKRAAFIQNWFRVHGKDQQGVSLMAEIREHSSEGVRVISRVPNLLSYMCILKRSEEAAHLPNGRTLLYKKVVDAYLLDLDRDYGLTRQKCPTCPFSPEDTLSLLSHVAAEIQRLRTVPAHPNRLDAEALLRQWHTKLPPEVSPPTNGNPTISESLIFSFLIPVIQRLQPKGDAPALLQQFLSYIASRSGLFLPRGNSKDGVHYGFTHFSFLEFFAACYVHDQLNQSERRFLAASRSTFNKSKWDREHPPGPISVTQASLASLAEEPLWSETIYFLAELRAANPDALDLLLQDLFPLLHGNRKDHPVPTPRLDKGIYALPQEKNPLEDVFIPLSAVSLAIRLAQNCCMPIPPKLVLGWYTRLLDAYFAWHGLNAFMLLKHMWPVPKLIFSYPPHAAIASRALKLAIRRHQDMSVLKFDDCRSIETLPPLPPSLWGLHVRNCISLERLPALPDSIEVIDLSGCTSLSTLPKALPRSLRVLYLRGCASLTSLPVLPPSLEDLALKGCVGLKGKNLPELPSNCYTQLPTS